KRSVSMNSRPFAREVTAHRAGFNSIPSSRRKRPGSHGPPRWLLGRHGVLFDVLIDAWIPVSARSPGGDVVGNLGVPHSVLFAQFAITRQTEFANIVPIGGNVVIAQKRQALIARRQLRSQARAGVTARTLGDVRADRVDLLVDLLADVHHSRDL